MTEAEALKKWCPMAIVRFTGYTSGNRLSDGRPAVECLCIGPACMAWRSTPSKDVYCGLAGKP